MTQPPATAAGPAEGPSYVLLEKGDPVRVMSPQNVTPNTQGNPLATRGYNSLIVDLLPNSTAQATSVTVLGAPTPGGPWLQEVDAQAFQSGVSTAKRIVVTGVSAFSAIALTAPAGWTVWLTPFNAASQTNVSITGTTVNNLAQYGGVAVGPSNPVDVRPNGAVDVSDRAGRALGVVASITNTVPTDPVDRAGRLAGVVTTADGGQATVGATTDAAVVTSASGTLSGKLRGLVAFFAACVSVTFGWLRVLVQPATFNLVGTSSAATSQTVTQGSGGAGVSNYLSALTVSWSAGAPAAGANVQVKDGSTVIWDSYYGQAGGTQGSNVFEFPMPLRGTNATALSVVVASGGGTVVTKVSAQGTTGP